MWSIQERFGLKPACSRRSCDSMKGERRLKMSEVRIFWMMLRREIPLQFLHSLRSPFLGIVTITPSFQVLGMSQFSQASVISGQSSWAMEAASHLNSSAARLSGPGALLLLSFSIATHSSSAVGGAVEISLLGFLRRLGLNGSVTSAGGVSEKNSLHLFNCA